MEELVPEYGVGPDVQIKSSDKFTVILSLANNVAEALNKDVKKAPVSEPKY